MGKTSKPLAWLIHPSLIQTSEDHAFVEEKRAQGHKIVVCRGVWTESHDEVEAFDIILAPNAWRCLDELEKSWELAAKSARAVKYSPGARATTAKKRKTASRRKKKDEDIAPADE